MWSNFTDRIVALSAAVTWLSSRKVFHLAYANMFCSDARLTWHRRIS